MYNDLYHHGVKGQKWGVRKGPPYPIEDKVLKKGTKLNSVSNKYINSKDYINNGKWMYTYRADEKYDNAVYKGPFALYLGQRRVTTFMKEHQFETIKDLKMPTKSERISEFKDLLNDKKFSKTVKKELENTRTKLVEHKIGSDAEQNKYKNFNVNNIKTNEDVNTAYEIFNHAMEQVHLNKSTSEYAKRISKKYDAMVDDNNQGIYNDAHDPIIIFRANEALKDIGNNSISQYLTFKDAVNNYGIVKQEMNKQGRKVKL